MKKELLIATAIVSLGGGALAVGFADSTALAEIASSLSSLVSSSFAPRSDSSSVDVSISSTPTSEPSSSFKSSETKSSSISISSGEASSNVPASSSSSAVTPSSSSSQQEQSSLSSAEATSSSSQAVSSKDSSQSYVSSESSLSSQVIQSSESSVSSQVIQSSESSFSSEATPSSVSSDEEPSSSLSSEETKPSSTSSSEESPSSTSEKPDDPTAVKLSWGETSGFGDYLILPGETLKIGSVSLISDVPEYEGLLAVTVSEKLNYYTRKYRLSDYLSITLVEGNVESISQGKTIFTIGKDDLTGGNVKRVAMKSISTTGDALGTHKYSVFVALSEIPEGSYPNLQSQIIDISVDWGEAN